METGLRGLIRDLIPGSWVAILKKERKLCKFIEYVYRDLPYTMKGRHGYKQGKNNLIVAFNRSKIYEVFQSEKSTEGRLYWVRLHNMIKDYEYQNN